MTRPLIITTLVVSLLIPAVCGASDTDTLPLGPKDRRHRLATVEVGQIIDTGTGKVVTMAEILQRCGKADLVVVGEYHDSLACHEFQRDLIAALAGKKERELMVGFEFFRRGDDPALAEWSAGSLEEVDLLRKTGWYEGTSMNYGYTRPVMDVIREHGIGVIGLNLPRIDIRRVASSKPGSLTPEESRLFRHLKRKNPEHHFYIQHIFGSAAIRLAPWFERIYPAQTCWDTIMAASMHEALRRKENRKRLGVIIAGSAHVAYGLGIPFRYRQDHRRAKMITIVPVRVEKPGEDDGPGHPMLKMMSANMPPAAAFTCSIADYVIGVPGPGEDALVPIDVSGHMDETVFVVDRVGEGSVLDAAGIRKGDRILSINGIPVTSQSELRILLGTERKTPPRIRLERTFGDVKEKKD